MVQNHNNSDLEEVGMKIQLLKETGLQQTEDVAYQSGDSSSSNSDEQLPLM